MDDRAGFLVGEGVSNGVGFSELSPGLIVIRCGVSISPGWERLCAVVEVAARDGESGWPTDGFV